MSKIEKELQTATEVTPNKGEDRSDYLRRLMKAVAGLSEKVWDGLTEAAQNWYNVNAKARNDAKKADKAIPDPLDFEQEEEEEKPRSRRATEDDEPKKGGADKGEKTAVEKLQEGDRVKLTTTRDKEISGTVVENSKRKEFVVIKGTDGKESEIEIDYDKVDSVEVFHGTAGSSEPDPGPAEPQVGDEVEITTKRDKVIVATLVELNDDEIVFEDKDGKDDLSRDRVKSIKVLKKAAGASKAKAKEDEPAGRKAKAKDEGATSKEPAEEGKRTRSSNPEGVSVGQRIKELIAEDLEITEEDIAKKLKKEGVEFKENTLSLNFKECHKFLAVLKEAKRLKA